MKLRYSATSPYVRKVTMTIIECGLEDKVERVATNAWDAETDLPADNPLGKVPALTTDDGTVLFDSPVICEYLDSLHDGAKLFPAAGPARWAALRLQALGDGLNDASVARRLEEMRPDGERSQKWIDRQTTAMARTLDVLEGEVDGFAGGVDIGALALMSALGYLDLRFAGDDWRSSRPKLAAWFDAAAKRRSYVATAGA
ncbi:MAG TPA: glutathione S-transferase N-terminal domain-containing protein [Azospirillaceae bacterium]|nr:glutathione S-transferase N-terminal domain-containing protein [Azospirillaceae bacterium]